MKILTKSIITVSTLAAVGAVAYYYKDEISSLFKKSDDSNTAPVAADAVKEAMSKAASATKEAVSE